MATPLRGACVYFPEANTAAIVAALHFNAAGILFEQDEPATVDDWRNSDSLASAVRSALVQFGPRERNLRDAKKTDWPSYRISHCRSVRQFEASYIRVFICAVNTAELFYDASAAPRGESDLSFHVTLPRNGPNDDFSRLLYKLVHACATWNISAA
jgi:hypothetical protein